MSLTARLAPCMAITANSGVTRPPHFTPHDFTPTALCQEGWGTTPKPPHITSAPSQRTSPPEKVRVTSNEPLAPAGRGGRLLSPRAVPERPATSRHFTAMQQLIHDAWLCKGRGHLIAQIFMLGSTESLDGLSDISQSVPQQSAGEVVQEWVCKWPTSQTGEQWQSPDSPWERHRTPRHASSPIPVLPTAASFLPKPTHTYHGDHLHFVTEGKEDLNKPNIKYEILT